MIKIYIYIKKEKKSRQSLLFPDFQNLLFGACVSVNHVRALNSSAEKVRGWHSTNADHTDRQLLTVKTEMFRS